MKAKAKCAFSASVNGKRFACAAGAAIDADEASVKHLESLGLVTATKPAATTKRASKPRKAAKND